MPFFLARINAVSNAATAPFLAVPLAVKGSMGPEYLPSDNVTISLIFILVRKDLLAYHRRSRPVLGTQGKDSSRQQFQRLRALHMALSGVLAQLMLCIFIWPLLREQ